MLRHAGVRGKESADRFAGMTSTGVRGNERTDMLTDMTSRGLLLQSDRQGEI